MSITATELKTEMEGGKLRLIDVRTQGEYSSMHIEGSELRPLGRLEVRDLGGEDCVIICRSGARAEMARGRFEAAGCRRVRVLQGGVLAWVRVGLPVERGASMVSADRQARIVIGLLVVVAIYLAKEGNAAWLNLALIAGAVLVFSGLTGWCPVASLLSPAPWNRRDAGTGKNDSGPGKNGVG